MCVLSFTEQMCKYTTSTICAFYGLISKIAFGKLMTDADLLL